MSDAVTRLNTALEGRYAIERELGNEDSGNEVFTPRITVVLNWFEELRARVPN